jgi:hypothetical protein
VNFTSNNRKKAIQAHHLYSGLTTLRPTLKNFLASAGKAVLETVANIF